MRTCAHRGVGIRGRHNLAKERALGAASAAGVVILFAARAVHAGPTFYVTSATGSGSGTLGYSIEQAIASGNDGATIDIQNNLGTIDVGVLPDITVGLTINGGVGNTISGQNTNRIFFVNAPGQSVLIESLTLANGLAHGGNGGDGAGGGGGGAGMGGAIFVNAGALNLQSVAFVGNAAAGGTGGTAVYAGGGGGGGLDFSGGSGTATVTFNGEFYLEGSGGGGGAHTGAGAASTGFSPGSGGGINGVGAGASAAGPDGGGSGGILDTSANNLYFMPKSGGSGGDFGGGGGGPGTINNSAGSGGNGGFGAGGGGGGDSDSNGYAGDGGNGGFGGGGGGGGGSSNEVDLGPSAGGASAFNGGNGGPGNEGGGGGGAALGASIFVRSTNGASLALSNCSTDAGSLTAGAGGYSELGNNGYGGGVSGGAMFLMGGTTAFTVSSGNAEAIDGTIAQSQASAISMNGGGILVLSANNGTASGYSGGTTINGGELSVAADNALGNSVSGLTFNGGLLQITGINDQSTARTVTLQSGGGGFDIASAANVFTVTQSIGGLGGLTKAGPGTLVLPTAEGYTGVTTITNGTLEAGFSDNGAATFPSSDAIVVDSGGTLMLGSASGQTNVLGSGANAPNVSIPSINLAGGALTNYADTTHNVGAIDLAGGLISGSSSTYSIFYDFTFNSPITVDASTQSSSITAAGGIGLRIQIPFNVSSGSGVLSVSAALHDEPNQSGGVTKDGPGVMELTGADSYSAGTIVNAGTLTFGAAGALPVNSALTINGGDAKFNNITTGATFLSQVSTLSIAGATSAWTGKLDLTNTDMIIDSGSLAALTNQVSEGFGNGSWNGPGGIISSAAATGHLTAIGVIRNNQSGAALFIGSNTFDGVVPAAGALLLKYTYYGDANLDGKVDASDYSRIDNGYLNGLTGWLNGDFNYDGVVNGSDYTLIDNAFNTQGAQISDAIAGPSAIATSQIAVIAAVPEPAVMGLAAVAMLALRRRRRYSSYSKKR